MYLLFHHIISFLFLPFAVYAKYIPWWQVGPGLFHAILLTFPDLTFLNYFYLLIMIIFHRAIYIKPFSDWFCYKAL